MGLLVLASVPIGGAKERELALDDITLMFFDTLIATLNAAFPEQRMPFDYFEYTDDDGDLMAVRTDEELCTMLAELGGRVAEAPLRIRLRSSRLSTQQQFSFDESDDIILAQQPSTSSSAESFEPNNLPSTPKAIGPEDLHPIERLSDGQFGTVCKALDVKNDQLVAVKCICMDGTGGTRQTLLNEIAILKKCVHPNIVQFYAALFVDNQLLICMELMDALSLDLYGQLPPRVLGASTVAVLDGLAHLWSMHIMHRDIKPSNLLVNSAGEVKLADFGVSKQMAQSVAWSYVGTKVYMAPERLYGEVYSVASDVWSLGVTLCEMALGRFPFAPADGSNLPSVDSLIFSADKIHQLLSQIGAEHIGNGFDALIAGCLRVDPHERHSAVRICQSEFLDAHRPMDRAAVSAFIAERGTAQKGQQSLFT